ncbi:hypothetical protein JQS43_07790 [Natronosporangium hydrolyticum]|uniref:Uncharacterized protein n=1 Tax=Natronosporangium hydrolyticum TaxID=2811111 RepID=A0A895YPZ5_9ACTN|nr:hypothetical protein [Natronosporangium hydrolyticum]QSB16190.1 hypothetical protein JQS43_07790 [Natronosporangium hydrolyticum]
MTDPISAGLAVRATGRLANSARPDAPIVDDLLAADSPAADPPPHPARRAVPRRPARRQALRRYAASGLRRLADRLEPALR